MTLTYRRKTHPFDLLLPATQRWSESLTDSARPYKLMETLPRIANRIANAWHDGQATLMLLDDLLIDHRGRRQGFSPFVQAELLRLRALRDDGRATPPSAVS